MKLSFADVRQQASDLQAAHSTRDADIQKYDEMYNLSPSAPVAGDWVKEVISPDPRNKIEGMKRLLQAADPIWSVRKQNNDEDVNTVGSQLERAAGSIWRRAGLLASRPAHYDPILSGLLYGEIHLVVQSTTQMAAMAPKDKRAKMVAGIAPIAFTCVHPGSGYPMWDQFGLAVYASSRKMYAFEARSKLGQEVASGKPGTEWVDVWDYWSIDQHVSWVDGDASPAIDEENRRDFIPVVCVLTEGSPMFAGGDLNMRQPVLYPVLKSHLWERQNMYQTLTASLAWALTMPQLVFKSDSDAGLDIDWSVPGGVIKVRNNENLSPLLKQVIDPAIQIAQQAIDERVEQSTIYGQTLGEPLGANATFSMVSLLSQAGRLPLVVYQRMISWALTKAMTIALKMVKEDNIELNVADKEGMETMKASDIPDNFDIEGTLDINMPQDARMNAQIAAQLRGFMPDSWIMENVLKEGQPDDIKRELWNEKFADTQMEIRLQQIVQQAQQQPAQGQPPIPGQAMQGQGLGEPGMETMPPGPGGASDGLPMTEPVDPRMMQGEGMPPEGGMF